MINIIQNGTTNLNVNKTMLDYCITLPLATHNCFNFTAIRNGSFGDDVIIDFNGRDYRGHINAKHIKRANPAFQVALPVQLRNALATLLTTNGVSSSITLHIDATSQKLYLI
ncbi:hypothetical protein [Clostridium tyrobutyricum]|uniref:hypothetical protein n=1 Tax=Clostridium tyrobutyricum TaxID=1519 RepID=UPI0011CBF9C4|nr:hypothetical protein [Clostridium tyrobutyricum]